MPTPKERIVAAQRYINAAQQIATTTEITGVRDHWEWLFANGVICEPGTSSDELAVRATHVIDRSRCERGVAKDTRLVILPLFDEDRSLGPPVEAMWVYNEQSAATYVPLGNVMFFRCPSDDSDRALGCTLLHEAGHAYRAYHEGRLGTPGEPGLSTRKLNEEVDMHTQDHLLWRAFDPSSYDTAIERGLFWMHKAFKRYGSDTVLYPLDSKGPWTTILDNLLGPPSSDVCRNARCFRFSIHVHFCHADRTRPRAEDSRHYKREIMRVVYAKFAPNVGNPIYE